MKPTLTRPSLLLIFTSLLAMLVLGGCVSSLQKRIETNPAIYGSLNNSQKALVSQGRITEGMSPNAVYLAWGHPDSIKTSSDRGQRTETWLYRGAEPVYTSYASYGYALGHRGYGRYGYYCPAYSYAPRVVYRSYVAGKVTFRGGRVVQWETTKR